MREILFRAKRLDNNEWVTGYYFQRLNDPTGEKHYIATAGTNQWYEIDSNTLCQFTGLTDENGNKIWENDIVDVSDCWWSAYGPGGHDSPIVLVEWNNYHCGFDPFANYDCNYWVKYNAKDTKIISNKFDNPELIFEHSKR